MKQKTFAFLKKGLIVGGILFLLLLILAFTSIPYHAYYQLSASNKKLSEAPDYIIIMGGSGMPSPDGLIKTYYGSIAANEYPKSELIIALPKNKDEKLSQLDLMADEIIKNGVDSNRIIFESKGYNTHSQSVNISKMIETDKSILIITSPEHMMRSILSFEKAGFKKVGSLPTFESPSNEALLKDKKKIGENEIDNLSLRYNLWSYLQYEIKVIREYFALSYYWIKGWI